MLDLHSKRFGFGPESSCAVCVTELIKPRDENRILLPYDLSVTIEIVHSGWSSLPLVLFSCRSVLFSAWHLRVRREELLMNQWGLAGQMMEGGDALQFRPPE